MTDIVDVKTRSRMMAGIRGRNTRPEMILRRGLHRLGFRYKLHSRELPGKPDMVFPKYRAIILVNGCFWHKHDCHLFRWPASRTEFWKEKITMNTLRDARNLAVYQEKKWRVLIVWECALKGKLKLPFNELLHTTANWLQFDDQNSEVYGFHRFK
jgi:DNA mismatch endonuclease (patch repair protein)